MRSMLWLPVVLDKSDLISIYLHYGALNIDQLTLMVCICLAMNMN